MKEWWLKIWAWIKSIFQLGSRRGGWWFLGVVLFLAVAAFAASAYEGGYYREKIFPGVKLGKVNLGGLTIPEAQTKIESWQGELNTKGMIFEVNNKGELLKVVAYPTIIAPTDPDLTRQIFSFSPRENALAAFEVGRNGAGWERVWEILTALVGGEKVDLKYRLDKDELKQFLKDNFSHLEKPAKNASLNFQGDQIFVLSAEDGFGFDYDEAVEKTENILRGVMGAPEVKMSLRPLTAEINREEVLGLMPTVEGAMKAGELTLTFEDKKWTAAVSEWKNWLDFAEEDGGIKLVFNVSSAGEFLNKVAGEIDQSAKEAKFKMSNGRVEEFQAQSAGREFDKEGTLKKMEEVLFKNGTEKFEVAVAVKETQAQINSGDVNNLGIEELVAIGKSNFAGSPKNRRVNIAVGAKLLNGLLIAPGEEFSTIKNLLPINATNGYLPELVIKGNRTVPEYGGGLCQIGTTVFRAALNAGLPITERQEHSYRVPYYEPAGSDATIYDPHPDLRFINDTGYYLLWQTRIEGDNLIFELWGTKDKREVTVGQPRIFNITNPGPTKIIESPDLKLGEKNCIERAHKGANATLSRKVIYPEGSGKENIDEVFSSFYRAWPEVCLVGSGGTVTSTSSGVEGTSGNASSTQTN